MTLSIYPSLAIHSFLNIWSLVFVFFLILLCSLNYKKFNNPVYNEVSVYLCLDINALLQTFVVILPFHTTNHDELVPLVQAKASCSSGEF